MYNPAITVQIQFKSSTGRMVSRKLNSFFRKNEQIYFLFRRFFQLIEKFAYNLNAVMQHPP